MAIHRFGNLSSDRLTGSFARLHLSCNDFVARTGLSMTIALAIGLERLVFRKPLEFRPFIVISLASPRLDGR